MRQADSKPTERANAGTDTSVAEAYPVGGETLRPYAGLHSPELLCREGEFHDSWLYKSVRILFAQLGGAEGD